MLRQAKSGINRFIHKKFVRNVFIVASGTAMAQVITMAFSPVVTRLYGPEAFGLLGVFTSLLAVLTPLAALTYPLAIVLPTNDNDAKKIGHLSAYIAVVISVLLVVILATVGDRLLSLLNAEALGFLAFLLPLAILFTAFVQIFQQWLIRKNQFSITARVAIYQSFLLNCFKVGFGFFYPIGGVLVALATLGHFLNSGLLFFGVKRTHLNNHCNKSKKTEFFKKKDLWKTAKRHHDFPLYRAPQVFINAGSQSLPLLMLSSLFGPATAGFYALCRSVLAMPTQLVSKSVGDVFYPRIVEAKQKGERLDILVIKATFGLVLIGIIPFGSIIAFGPWLFTFAFGADWVSAGTFARWLAIMMFFFFINKPSVVTVPVINRQGGLLIYEFFSTGTKILAIYVGAVLFNDAVLAVALFSASGAVAYICLIIWVVISCNKGYTGERVTEDVTKTG